MHDYFKKSLFLVIPPLGKLLLLCNCPLLATLGLQVLRTDLQVAVWCREGSDQEGDKAISHRPSALHGQSLH